MKPNLVVLAAVVTMALNVATARAQTPPPAPPPPAAPPPAQAAPPAQPRQPSFPAPKVVAVTDALKCDWGAIKSSDSGQLVVATPAGLFTVLWSDARIIGADPNARISPAALKPDQNVRVYYLVKDGARALEIDLIAAPAPVSQ
jgi:glucose/arabinose dehydrogenase